MIEPALLKGILSFLSGLILGWLNFRLYEKSLRNLDANDDKKSIRKLVVGAGIFRHVFIFLAGISLIRAVSLPSIHLCGGLLMAAFGYRIDLIRRSR